MSHSDTTFHLGSFSQFKVQKACLPDESYMVLYYNSAFHMASTEINNRNYNMQTDNPYPTNVENMVSS